MKKSRLKKLKQVEIDGIIYNYEVGDDPIWGGSRTHFYRGRKITTFKLFFFFGPTITIINPIHIFTVNFDVETCSLSKKQLKKGLKEKV